MLLFFKKNGLFFSAVLLKSTLFAKNTEKRPCLIPRDHFIETVLVQISLRKPANVAQR